MDLGIAGKTALVTGASKGIGFAVARGLAAEGARVMLSARGEADLERAVEAIRVAGGEAAHHAADAADGAALEALLEATRERFGDPAIVVANAGGPPPGVPTDLGETEWERGWNLTLMSAVRLARLALPPMRAAGWGRIVHVTSVSVKEPIPTLTLSNAYRAAVTAFAKTLAAEVAADGVTVNNVAPGYTLTERLSEVVESDEARAALLERIPAGRFATPEEIGAVAVFLASTQAAYLTGQTIAPDGGAVGSLL